MSIAILTVGLPGSGKSTWARQQEGFCVIERDIVRGVFFDIFSSPERAKEYYAFDIQKKEAFVSHVMDEFFRVAKKVGRNIIVADTNLNIKVFKSLTKKFQDIGFTVYYKSFMDVPVEQIKEWNRKRFAAKVVPDEVIDRMLKRGQWVEDISSVAGIIGVLEWEE